MDVISTPLAEAVIGAAIDVHKALGPGLLETPYRRCLQHELTSRGIKFEAEVPRPLFYKGVTIDCTYRIDLLVENTLVVEIKTVEHLLPVHSAQVLTYLRLLRLRQGLLFNFHVAQLIQGLKSILNPSAE